MYQIKVAIFGDDETEQLIRSMAEKHDLDHVILSAHTTIFCFQSEDQAEDFGLEFTAWQNQQNFLDFLSEEEAYLQYRLFV